MRSDSRRIQGVEFPTAPGWMVSFGDMMGLILSFFVLLVSFSSISEEGFSQASASLRTAFGALPDNASLIPISAVPAQPSKPVSKNMERLAREMQEKVQVLGKEKDIQVQFDVKGGLKISLPSRILFDSASADLKPEAYPVLKELAEVLGGVSGAFIEVRGYTDSRHLVSKSKFRDNHDLSYGRADRVARYLNTVGRVPFEQMEIIGCGPSQPVATNDTEEGRQANRRVEIYVRPTSADNEMNELRSKIDTLTTGHPNGQDE